jgi:hypothetical protein
VVLHPNQATDTPVVSVQATVTPKLTPEPAPTVLPSFTATCIPSHTPTAAPSATPTASPTPWACVVTADVLNLRAGPGVVYQIIDCLAQGEPLHPEGRSGSGGWLLAHSAAGQQGWVTGQWVICGGDLEELAILTPPPLPTPTATTAVITAAHTPTPPSVAYQYLPAGPAQADSSQSCPGCPLAPVYIHGQVRDAGGNPLPGVRLVCSNDWHRYPVAASKGDGWYDFPVVQASTVWYMVVVDENDQPISPLTPVDFDISVACWYRLDWQRAF